MLLFSFLECLLKVAALACNIGAVLSPDVGMNDMALLILSPSRLFGHKSLKIHGKL